MASHLSLVLDLAPAHWHRSTLSLAQFLPQLLVFLNAHIALTHDNSLAVFAALPGKSVMLYPPADPAATAVPPDPNAYLPFRQLDAAIVTTLAGELDSDAPADAPTALVGALTKALCYINRISPGGSAPSSDRASEPRILILSVSPDLSTSYIPIMNAIFSAQKMKITIDACQIFGPDTVFLQQAAHLTGGSYLFLDRRDALLQYLIMAFLPPPATRKVLAVPTQDKIDFRAACFCHKNIVDIGFVCSVCLSIFCQPVPVCSTCRTKFPIKTLKRLNAARPPPLSTNTPRPSAAGTPVPRPPLPADAVRNGVTQNPHVPNGARH